MADMDSAKHKVEEAKGSVKENLGDLTDNEKLQHEGRDDQIDAKEKQAMDSLKDSVEEGVEAAKKSFGV
jgi:uncharacterized protein YjbJ (UPF0337 family)